MKKSNAENSGNNRKHVKFLETNFFFRSERMTTKTYNIVVENALNRFAVLKRTFTRFNSQMDYVEADPEFCGSFETVQEAYAHADQLDQ